MSRGYISNEYTVWCGVCQNWEREAISKRLAIKRWHAAGWRKTRKTGWTCPSCLFKQIAQRLEAAEARVSAVVENGNIPPEEE